MGINGSTNNGFFDIAQIASLYVGILNLYENREQSAHNDVSEANDKQSAYILADINAKFDEQNAMIRNIMDKLGIKDGD